MKILSWNVNGIRAAEKKGLFKWFQREKPDILCLQEIKALPEQVPNHLRNMPNYNVFWNSAERKGYSGVSTFTKEKPFIEFFLYNFNYFKIFLEVLINLFDIKQWF